MNMVLGLYFSPTVSGYRIGNPIKTSMDRLYSTAIGGIVAVLVNVLIFPMWAGEQLHQELVNNFNSVADSLQECVKKYLEDDGSNHPEFSAFVLVDEFPDEIAYKKCKSALSSSPKLENLANAAKWEPPHGRFCHFFYPWLEYIKVNAVLRYCAYEVMALHGVLHSEIQAPYNLRITFQKEIQDVTSEASELVRCLGKNISSMQKSIEENTALLKKVHTLSQRLQSAIDLHSYLLTPLPLPLPANVITKQVSSGLSQNLLASNTSSDDDSLKLYASRTELVDHDNDKKLPIEGIYSEGVVLPPPPELGVQMSRKQSTRQYSWPSREVDAFEEGACVIDVVSKMRALESTAAVSLATFTSLLIEFVARLDHLVEAVDHLATMAKFKS